MKNQDYWHLITFFLLITALQNIFSMQENVYEEITICPPENLYYEPPSLDELPLLTDVQRIAEEPYIYTSNPMTPLEEMPSSAESLSSDYFQNSGIEQPSNNTIQKKANVLIPETALPVIIGNAIQQIINETSPIAKDRQEKMPMDTEQYCNFFKDTFMQKFTDFLSQNQEIQDKIRIFAKPRERVQKRRTTQPESSLDVSNFSAQNRILQQQIAELPKSSSPQTLLINYNNLTSAENLELIFRQQLNNAHKIVQQKTVTFIPDIYEKLLIDEYHQLIAPILCHLLLHKK